MSDGEKPFDATPRRLARARREGDIARAGELAANFSFAAAALATGAFAGTFASAAGAAILASQSSPAPENCAFVVVVALVAIACASSAGVVASLAQSGGPAFVAVTPKFERLNPVEGLKRIFSRETLNHSLRAALGFTCALLAMSPIVAAGGAAMIGAPVARAAARAWSDAGHVAFAACAVGMLFSFAEYGAARRIWLRKLRMTLHERKRELKEEEGDASARGRRRALHRALLRGGLARVKESAFVVVNPSHVAVALAYRPPRVPVPEVIVRAIDDAALRVRAAAERFGIPLIEDPVLARALLRDARTGEPIPAALYVAVAEVVAALVRDGALPR